MKINMEKSFTLIEVLVVTLVIGIISALLYKITTDSRNLGVFTNAISFSSTLKNSLAENIVGNWSFFEGTGSAVFDSSRYHANGTITNATWETNTANCINNNCMNFSGALNQYVQMSAIPLLATGSPFVISAWAYPQTTGTYRTIVGYNGSHRLLINNVGTMLSQQGTNFYSATGAVPDDRWTNVVYWNSGTEERWYINGFLSGSPQAMTLAEWDGAFKVGQYDLANYPFKGRIDEIVIYNSSITLSQIKDNYFSGLNSLLSRGLIDLGEYSERTKELAYTEK